LALNPERTARFLHCEFRARQFLQVRWHQKAVSSRSSNTCLRFMTPPLPAAPALI
jgi:hypothetical protein